jgi:hypothetical protein
MAKGIDAHKKYKLTANSIAKIVMQIWIYTIKWFYLSGGNYYE